MELADPCPEKELRLFLSLDDLLSLDTVVEPNNAVDSVGSSGSVSRPAVADAVSSSSSSSRSSPA